MSIARALPYSYSPEGWSLSKDKDISPEIRPAAFP